MTTYHHGDLREALLRSASKILEKEGIAGLSVRHAARRAKVSHNAPYRHFPDKESLLAALAERGRSQLEEELKAVDGRALGEAYVRFALAHPQLFRLMSGGAHPSSAYEALVRRFRAHATEEQAQVAAAAAWSVVHGLSHLLLDGHFVKPRSEAGSDAAFARQVLDAVRYVLPAQRSA
jgi:AcrR family transcriptional regulator